MYCQTHGGVGYGVNFRQNCDLPESYRKPYQPKVDPAQIHVKVILSVYRKMDQWRYRELNHLLVYLYN